MGLEGVGEFGMVDLVGWKRWNRCARREACLVAGVLPLSRGSGVSQRALRSAKFKCECVCRNETRMLAATNKHRMQCIGQWRAVSRVGVARNPLPESQIRDFASRFKRSKPSRSNSRLRGSPWPLQPCYRRRPRCLAMS